MKNIFERGLKLFDGIIYKSIKRYPTFIHIKSVFSDEWYNFIIPTIEPNKLDWSTVKSIIGLEKQNKTSMSYYVPDQYLDLYKDYFSHTEKRDNISSDLYICKEIDRSYESVGDLVLLSDSTIAQYTSMAKICFPEWANNEQYALHMYAHQKQNKHHVVKNYLLRVDNKYVGFCGLIGLVEENLAYFHNVGVLPEFRRRGYFTCIINHLMNTARTANITNAYALVEQDSNSYHGLIKLGYAVEDKYHLFSTI